eukprot:evm.model.scf_2610.1 EVM.evm.TU.scf_2610.1   scf_2610:2799-4464(-)
MLNLCVLREWSLGCEAFCEACEGALWTTFCVDAATGRAYLASSDCAICCIAYKERKLAWHLPLSPTYLPSPNGASPLMISFLLELESLFLCLSSGELLLIDCKGEDVEDVGIVEGSLAAAAWSPDGEILALVSGQGNLLLMNMEWEVLSEVCLHQAMSLSVVGEENGSTVVSNVAVSWRGDGQYFAVLGELN